MALKEQELGERIHIDALKGVLGFPGFRGIRREGDPASIPDSNVWNAENLRLQGGEFISRGGQAKVNADTIGSFDIQGFFDATDIGA